MIKLMRPSEGRIIGGVCQGIANFPQLDPTVVSSSRPSSFMAGSGSSTRPMGHHPGRGQRIEYGDRPGRPDPFSAQT